MAWDPDHIDFISEYCDRWCERCPLTHKCAAFTRESDPEEIEACAASVERAMEEFRVELAPTELWRRHQFDDLVDNVVPSEAEQREFDREWEARRARVRSNPMMVTAYDYSVDAYTWLKLYGELTRARAEAALAECSNSPEAAVLRMELEGVLDALAVVQWDSTLIPAKLRRAIDGREDGADACGGEAAQTDFNGSAKVTLILAARSEAGWRLIARWSPESHIATQLGDTLVTLGLEIEREFPAARRFIRPGFDEMRP